MSDMTDQGCSDGGCDLRDRRGGQHTNGGCHCLDALDGETRFRLRRYMRHTREARDSLATQLDDAKQVIVTLRATMEQVRRERDYEIADRNAMAKLLTEARATNARLNRRAQGVDARSPDDADLIRRLRADVRGQAKHAGYVAGHVFRLQLAANFAQHATSMAVRERDEARAKLERIRETLAQRSVMAVGDVFADALRIIDEKEGDK